VLFGRKQEITAYLGILDTLRGAHRPQVLVISGGSACGKSSLPLARPIPARSSLRSRRVGHSRRIGRVFWNIRVHVIPGLGALDENVGLRPKPARIVEAGDADADQIGPGRDLDI